MNSKSRYIRQVQERRDADRQREREETQRQAALERKQQEQRELQREEERREERRREERELDAALAAQRQAREALIMRIRSERRERQAAAARKALQHASLIKQHRESARMGVLKERKKNDEEENLDLAGVQRAGEQRDKKNDERKQQDAPRSSKQRTNKSSARDDAGKRAKERASERRIVPAKERAAGRTDELEVEHTRQLREARKTESDARERDDERRQAARDARAEQARELTNRADVRDEAQAAARERERQRKADEAAQRQEVERRRQVARDARAAQTSAQGSRTPALAPTTPELPTRDSTQRSGLSDRLASGVLSASLPWLRVQGNMLKTLDGKPVILRGVSVVSELERLDEVLAWRPSVIRLAINRAHVLRGFAVSNGMNYLEYIDQLVAKAAASGVYTMLSLRRLDSDTAFGITADAQPYPLAPQPDYDAIGMWRILGERYASEPAVLYDLYSTPHPALQNDLTGMYSDWSLWALWTRLAVADLRRANPGAVCFVAGLNWGTDLSGFPISGTDDQPIANLVYAAHIHSRSGIEMAPLRALARRHPVFVTEWSARETEIAWSERTAMLLDGERIGWTAAHWTGDPTADTPLVRTGSRGELIPTRFGCVVRRSLALAA